MSNFIPAWFKKGFFNESLFCDDFLSIHQLLYSNGAFFTPDGRMVDPMPLRCEIFEMMREYVGANLAKKVTNVVDVLKLAAQVEDFPPVTDRIALANGTLYLDGTFQEGKPEIVRNRLPVKYDPKTTQPTHWLRFLSDLLYPEDIPTVQEFIGYCLIPSNKGQRMMVIKGSGGEGKSQIGVVLSRLFGCNMKDGSIGKISENRFARADLEHTLLCVDDDMRMIEDTKKWVLSPERKALQATREYAAHCLDTVLDKFLKTMQTTAIRLQEKLLRPEIRQKGKEQVREKARDSVLQLLSRLQAEQAQNKPAAQPRTQEGHSEI